MQALKIKVLSDIHLEFSQFEIEKDDCDMLILCGDVCEIVNTTLFLTFIEKCCSIFDEVIYIPGNHEYYNSSIQEVNNFLKNIKYKNFIYLNEKTFRYHNIVFIGAVLWSNISNENSKKIQNHINDYRLIRNFTVEESNALHNKHKVFIDKNLDTYRDFIKVVITHHTPLIHNTSHPKFDNSFTNEAFSTDLSPIVKKADYWICGHTHYCNDFMFESCRVILNCKGYSNNKNFDSKKFISLSI